MNEQQKIQEDEYDYPYHYIGKYSTGFSHFVIDEWAINYVSTIEYLIDLTKGLSPKVVLDLGCGDGRLTMELQRALKRSKIIGVDYSDKAINLAKDLNPNCYFLKKNILRESLTIKSDLVILMEVIEHIPINDLKKFIEKIYSLLKPGGCLILTVPHKNKTLEKKHFQHFDSKSIFKYFNKRFLVNKIVFIERISFLSKLISLILNNQYILIRYRFLLNTIYRLWKKYVFTAPDEGNCSRMIIVLNKKDKDEN